MKATPKKMLLAALLALAPAGVALAAQDCSGDAHAAYRMALGGDDPGYRCVAATWQQAGAAGPSGPIIAAADTACGRDPFEGYRRAFGTGGPAHLCGLMVPAQGGAQGPAGPTMADERIDPFYGYSHTFLGD
jgi:hypothetical protein